MLEDFQKHINNQLSFLISKKLLLAVSGGLDSLVLLHLCQRSGYEIAVAHCNFQLRGNESDEDAAFVEKVCDEHKIAFYKKSFDTKDYARAQGISTQMAARDLRYEWFNELLSIYGHDYLLTAHHLNDDLETFLINLGRGTGLKGLTGVPEINGKTVRPLLKFSRKRILQYAKDNGIKWREDASNASDDYMRNHLRHHAIPALEQAHSDALQGFEKTQSYLKQAESLLRVYDQQLRQQYTHTRKNASGNPVFSIDLDKLEQHPEPNAVLYRLLSHAAFTAWEDVYNLRKAQSGKQVFSKKHRLLKNRNTLDLYVLEKEVTDRFQWTAGEQSISGPFGSFTLEQVTTFETRTKNSIIVPSELLKFPLTIRKWEDGDYFYPFGMKGKKKLSKYFKDEKLSLVEKKNVWLLCSAETIIWIIGRRSDDRFKVTDISQKMTRLTISYD